MLETCAASPAHLQLQSVLVNLPAEIKHHIFRLCLTFDHVISDPVIYTGPQNTKVQSSKTAILQTCKRLYHEIDHRPLFSRNTLRFTDVETARTFLKTIDRHQRESIHDIEIDVRNIDNSLARNWLRYLAWGNGAWDSNSSSLHMDAPNLKTLRLNFESWPRISMFRTELWILLRQMMATVRGLERIIVVGSSKGQAMARRDPWSPAHFVGATNVEFDDLVPRMWRCVGAKEKMIRWTRDDGRLSLEVVSSNHLAKYSFGARHGPAVEYTTEGCWPVSGSCSWLDYESRNRDSMG